MTNVEHLRSALPETAKDVKLNLEAVLQGGSLGVAQRWGVAIASAAASRNGRLRDAILADARREVDAAIVDDALAAATPMAMTNVYYRFCHIVGKPSYAARPARLRMKRLGRPASDKANLELFSLAASAIAGCEACVVAHEGVLIQAGVSEEQIHDAIRIAATVHAVAVALELGPAALPSDAARVAESAVVS